MAVVLVTGADGFIGRPLVNFLECGAHEVVPFSFRCFLAGTSHAIPPADCIIHLGALVHEMNSNQRSDELEYMRVNIDGVKKLAIEGKKAGCKRFIFISSVKAMGESTANGEKFKAGDICAPQDLYGRSKLAAENALFEIGLNTGLEIVVLRLPLVYGPNVKGNLATLVKAIKAGIPLPLAAAHNKRSLLSVENLVSVIEIAISHPAAKNEIFLVSDDEDISTVELIKSIAAELAMQAKIFWAPIFLLRVFSRIAGKRGVFDRLFGNLQLDVQKTKKHLGWEPALKFHKAIVSVAVNQD